MSYQHRTAMLFATSNPPSSPPSTPSARRYCPSFASHAPPIHHLSGIYFGADSPPSDGNIGSIGRQSPIFLRSSQSRDSSRPSTASGLFTSESRLESPIEGLPIDNNFHIDNDNDIDDNEYCEGTQYCQTTEATFVLTEMLGNESACESEIEVVRPDNVEDVESENDVAKRQMEKDTDKMAGEFKKLHCSDDDNDSAEERSRQRKARRKQRLSGLWKRSHSQTIGSDAELNGAEGPDPNDVRCSTRRLRRKVCGRSDLRSLNVEDIPSYNLLEMEGSLSGQRPFNHPSFLTAGGGLVQNFSGQILREPMEL